VGVLSLWRVVGIGGGWKLTVFLFSQIGRRTNHVSAGVVPVVTVSLAVVLRDKTAAVISITTILKLIPIVPILGTVVLRVGRAGIGVGTVAGLSCGSLREW
jgi:predicted LPLAT superfamily acyltransferase